MELELEHYRHGMVTATNILLATIAGYVGLASIVFASRTDIIRLSLIIILAIFSAFPVITALISLARHRKKYDACWKELKEKFSK